MGDVFCAKYGKEKYEKEKYKNENQEMNVRELEFAIFCIENLSMELGIDATEVYDMLTRSSDILYSYIVPCYEPLHSQGKGYIMDDLKQVMRERGLHV